MLSNPEMVKTNTSIKPADLQFETTQQLDTWLENRLQEITEFIYQEIHHTYDNPEQAPLGLHLAATQMAHNVVMNALTARQAPVMRYSDWDIKVREANIYTDQIKQLIKPYVRGEKISFVIPKRTLSDDEESVF